MACISPEMQAMFFKHLQIRPSLFILSRKKLLFETP